jgi:predicted alpha/beta-hydrolase family hydrolase
MSIAGIVMPDGTELPYQWHGEKRHRRVLVLAHGAGAGMDHWFMQEIAAALAKSCCAVLLFQFPYRAKGKRLPDRPPTLLAAFKAAIKFAQNLGHPIFIGGKSMGGRMASMLAAEPGVEALGVVCLGYPLIPPGKDESAARIEHLPNITLPTLVLQGETDEFGTPDLCAKFMKVNKRIKVVPVANVGHSFESKKAQVAIYDKLVSEITKLMER